MYAIKIIFNRLMVEIKTGHKKLTILLSQFFLLYKGTVYQKIVLSCTQKFIVTTIKFKNVLECATDCEESGFFS